MVPEVKYSSIGSVTRVAWAGAKVAASSRERPKSTQPAGRPAAVVQSVHRDTTQVMGEAEVKARLYVQGLSPVVNSTADFTRQIDQELVRWAKVVAARKLQAN